ncbi:MAG: hypothetical protein K6G19_07115 [Lachnospiraceae bacterium]|nr:hypothetical protein [Lachnospiraceae bacterium]
MGLLGNVIGNAVSHAVCPNCTAPNTDSLRVCPYCDSLLVRVQGEDDVANARQL